MRLVATCLLLMSALWSCRAFAEVQEPGIAPFGSANLLEQSKDTVGHYRLVLSELKRSRATTYGEQERRLSGELWRQVWAVDKGFDLDEVSQFFSQQLQSYEILYQCQALDCGSSHFWANQVFSNSRLVGREQYQRYMVAKSATVDGKTQVFVIYIVQRGSKQILVNVDRLITRDEVNLESVNSKQILSALNGHFGWLPGLMVTDGRLDLQQSQALISVLKGLTASNKRRLYLMTHCYDANQMADNLQCSERLAKQLRVATFDGAHELNILGQGALSPSRNNSLQPALRFVFWPQR